MNRLEQIKKEWGSRMPERIDGRRHRDSAVLVPLIFKDKELRILFEVRADKLKNQPGEVCFPGGAIEACEVPRIAALRETAEELLVQKDQIDILAPLDILVIPTGMAVYPFLGALTGYEDTFSTDEVEKIVMVPFDWFLSHEPEVYHTKVLTVPGDHFPFELIPGGKDYKWRQGNYDVLFYQYDGVVIWGMTAKILHSFISMYKERLR